MEEVLYRVIYGDTDCGGVMYYGNYLRLFEIGRTEYIRRRGLTYKSIEEERGLLLPVVEVWARYRSSARYDDVLTIRTTLLEARSHKVVFGYTILRNRDLLVEGHTIHVPINREGKITRLPKEIIEILQKGI
ncbi:MAG: acyl-CoA thioesterase [Caldimicrobium sp.]|nr:acyl-CoA thioesterase [Caldimicrobium sp.]MCX7874031.1 acyl-CoA thioesterase [Caldimicrobium sp.]MDW8093855.1 thioesterase family protein [Caldimicrobium sp.]